MVEQLLPDLPDETIPILMRIVEEQLENKCGRDQAYELLGKLQKVSEPTSFEEFLGRCQMRVFGTGVLGTRYCRVPGSWYRAEGCVGPDR